MVDRPRIEVTSRQQWRDWLTARHAGSDGIWLGTHQKRHDGYLPDADVVQGALAFGWIDSLPAASRSTGST